MELQIAGERRQCLKCGYTRGLSDAGPDYACPKCGAVYAKLQALQEAEEASAEADAIEARNFERRIALEENFEQEQVEREAAERPQYVAANAVYLLMILPFVVTQALAIAIAYKMRRPVDDSWLNIHFKWQIRTFWYLVGLSALAGAALLIGSVSLSIGALFRASGPMALSFKSLNVFVVICAVAFVTALYRIGKGWYHLLRREAP